MKARILQSTQELEDILPEIEELYSLCDSANPYYSSLWVSVWWKHFAGVAKPRILTLWSEQQKLVAFWPLYEVKVVSGVALWPMLYNVADYFDPLIHRENYDEIASELIRLYLNEIKKYAYVWTLVIREKFYNYLKPESEKLKNKRLLNTAKQRLFIEMEGIDYDSLINSKLGTKSQKTLRYTRKKLEEQGQVAFLDLETADDIEPYLPTMCEVEQSSWKAAEGIGVFAMPGLRAFFFELLPLLAESKQVRLSILKIGEEAIAYQLGLLSLDYYGLNCLTYKQKYHEFSPGRHLMLHTLKTSFEKGVSLYDFMIGDQEYKQKFATNQEPLPALHLFQRSIKGWVNRKAIEANMAARNK